MPYKSSDVAREYMKGYYQRKKEKIRAYQAANMEHIKEQRRKHYAANKEKVRAKMAEYRAKVGDEKVLAWHRKGNKDYTRRLRDELLAAYGNKCACCGETEREFLTLDHVGGGGNIHRRTEGWKARGKSLFLRLKAQGFPKDKWQLLCMNCNFAVRNGAICPHQKVDVQSILEGIAC